MATDQPPTTEAPRGPKWAAYTVFLAYDDKPPSPSLVESLLEAGAGIHNATATQDCEPCARFGSHHPCHPGEAANPQPELCLANMMIRLADFSSRIKA